MKNINHLTEKALLKNMWSNVSNKLTENMNYEVWTKVSNNGHKLFEEIGLKLNNRIYRVVYGSFMSLRINQDE